MNTETLTANKDRVVSFHYVLADSDGTLLEDSKNGEISQGQPVVYLHGHQGLLPELEKSLAGKTVGDTITVTLTPEQAYGRRRESAIGRVPLKNVKLQGQRPVKGKLKPGTIVEIKTAEGIREATVIKQGLKNVDVDTNHPYADKTLTFSLEVVAVRAATEAELAHGHAHGAGGCNH